ncbi:DUF4389 domain-containing protein [Thalassobius sp. S69A]|uniref:DUF4389 domain-containing protein n=1 Tax=unclassified Thalassovita TaxID=2619711 RepID=UPI000C10E960|nr:hypothetical protein [Paracoccaceae bacterium]MBT26877.1 hypothetical protein [Paracoccaceae bacterium]
MNDEDKLSGRLHGEQFEPDQPEGLLMRIVHVLIIGVMMSLTQTVLGVLTLIQIVIMALNKGEPNENLANFGTDLGVWMAKSVRYMTAASDVKPWPWTELD